MIKNITQQMQNFVFVLILNHLHICSVIIMYFQKRTYFTTMKNCNHIKFSILQSLLAMVLVFAVVTSLSAQSEIAGWERIYTFPGEELAEAKSVVQTYDEGFVMLIQDRSNKFRVIKTDPDGDILWENQYGNLTPEEGRKIVQLQDGSYAVVSNCSNCGAQAGSESISIFRIDRFGETIGNSQVFGLLDTDIVGNSIKATSDGGLIIAGIAITDDNAEQDYFIKLDATGNIIFEKSYGSENREFIRDIEETPDGFIATGYQETNGDAGLYFIKLNTEGDSLWSDTYDNGGRKEGYAVAFTYDDNNQITGYIAAGYTATASNGEEIYLVRVDENGDEQGTNLIPGVSLTDQAYDIQNTNDGGYILTGTMEPNGLQTRTFLTKLTKDLEIEWSEDFGVITSSLATSQGLNVAQTKDNGYAVVGFQSDPNDFNITYSYLLKTNSEGQIFSNYIDGRVFNQLNNQGINDWVIQAIEQDGGEGRSFFATADADGNFELLLTTGAYDISVITPNSYWEPNITYAVNIPVANTRQTLNFPVMPVTTCTDLEVDISTPYLIPGSTSIYTVRYCNHGNQLAENAFVDVVLDENILVLSSSIPSQQVGPIYRFQIGDMAFGDCGDFTIETILQNANAIDQQTHCVEASIFPNALCDEIDPEWDGSSIKVTATCDTNTDSVRFEVINQGSSPLLSPTGIIIIEDQVLRDQPQPGLLNAGEVFRYALPANGATYRIAAQQATGHPGDSRPTAAIEGCGGDLHPGHYTRFPEDDYNYSNEIDCQENVDTPISNLKRGYPKGAGDSLLIAADAEMIYHLKFQNTGNETAIRVVIRDTISPHLDPTTIRPGASSHDYDFEVYAGGILKFTFEDILLPNSSTDEAGSHIFVKYRISQKPNNEDGTPLSNGTAITFEYNVPENLIDSTNYIGGPTFLDLLVSTNILHPEVEDIKVYPNPFSETATFELTTTENFRNLQFTLYDLAGRQVKQTSFSGNRFELQKTDLTSGMYVFRIEADGVLISTGKIIAK